MASRVNPTRLIPWCLAATGFVVAFTVSAWQSHLLSWRQSQATAADTPAPAVARQHRFWSLPTPAAAAAPPDAAMAAQPLPAASYSQPPELDPDGGQVIDDSPVVDDLPGRPAPDQQAY